MIEPGNFVYTFRERIYERGNKIDIKTCFDIMACKVMFLSHDSLNMLVIVENEEHSRWTMNSKWLLSCDVFESKEEAQKWVEETCLNTRPSKGDLLGYEYHDRVSNDQKYASSMVMKVNKTSVQVMHPTLSGGNLTIYDFNYVILQKAIKKEKKNDKSK